MDTKRTPAERTVIVNEIMDSTLDAFMRNTYGEKSWRQCARALVMDGLDASEAIEFLRSKHMRWADDAYGAGVGRDTTSATLQLYLDRHDSGDGHQANGCSLRLGR